MAVEKLVSVFMGSKSDLAVVSKGLKIFDSWQLPYSVHILSAHRTGEALEQALKQDIQQGVRVVIGAAGMAAHLPGVLASKTELPVIGVPLDASSLNGFDALLSIVQMPAGVPVATMAIGSAGMQNAAIFAAQIISGEWLEKVKLYRQQRSQEVLAMNTEIETKSYQDLLPN